MTESSQPPRRRRGARLHRDKSGNWTLWGDEEVEDLSPLPPIADWAGSSDAEPLPEPEGVDAERAERTSARKDD